MVWLETESRHFVGIIVGIIENVQFQGSNADKYPEFLSELIIVWPHI